MKNLLTVVCFISLLSLFNVSATASLMFDWEFTIGDASPDGVPGDVISGTIAGLVEGANSAGLMVFVDPLPTSGTVLDQNWFWTGGYFNISGGAVADVSLEYTNGDNYILSWGTDPYAFVGSTTFPRLVLQGGTEDYVAVFSDPNNFGRHEYTPTRFSPSNQPPPPPPPAGVPAPATLALLGLGLAGLGYSRRKKA